MPERRRILMADDHPLMRTALAQAVSRALSGIELIEAANLDEVISAFVPSHPTLRSNWSFSTYTCQV
jgi:DNA-binding NarL/FixJ family response regulator